MGGALSEPGEGADCGNCEHKSTMWSERIATRHECGRMRVQVVKYALLPCDCKRSQSPKMLVCTGQCARVSPVIVPWTCKGVHGAAAQGDVQCSPIYQAL